MALHYAAIFGVVFILLVVILGVALTWLGWHETPYFAAEADTEDVE